MKVVGIVGSPRRGGNTEILTQIALEEIKKEGIETELISLAEKRIAPCDGCRSCIETGKCHIKDDFDSIFAKMKKADGIILERALIIRFVFVYSFRSFCCGLLTR